MKKTIFCLWKVFFISSLFTITNTQFICASENKVFNYPDRTQLVIYTNSIRGHKGGYRGNSVVYATFFIRNSKGQRISENHSLRIFCEDGTHAVEDGYNTNIFFRGYITGNVGRYLCGLMGYFHPPAH